MSHPLRGESPVRGHILGGEDANTSLEVFSCHKELGVGGVIQGFRGGEQPGMEEPMLGEELHKIVGRDVNTQNEGGKARSSWR